MQDQVSLPTFVLGNAVGAYTEAGAGTVVLGATTAAADPTLLIAALISQTPKE